MWIIRQEYLEELGNCLEDCYPLVAMPLKTERKLLKKKWNSAISLKDNQVAHVVNVIPN